MEFKYDFPRNELLIKFLENNGRNLKEIYLHVGSDDPLNLDIARFCPNLKLLSTVFRDDEMETLRVILNRCQQLEVIGVWCGEGYLNQVELLQVHMGVN